MFLEVFSDNPYGTNCWLMSADDSPEILIVDPGFEPGLVHSMVAAAGRTPAAVLLTHAHLDHAEQAGAFAGETPVMVHPADALAFTDPQAWNPGFANPLTPVSDLRTFQDGERMSIAGLELEVMHTPGHTPGHCMFRAQGVDALVLSGDLVFAGAIGRSDFPNSSPSDMRASLLRFLALEDDLPVYPGHGPTTTVGVERRSNPFLAELA